MPERLAHRAALTVTAARTTAQRAPTQPEQIQTAEQAKDIEHRTANLAGPDDSDQRCAAPQHIAKQVTTEKTRTGLASA
ncbi:hypothetical protein D3C77_734880 [compost metagenome]